tara:strand:- start:2643 stop:3260 length:618 start_codon:yes stop_codon:yes gene_type:complete
MNRNIILLLIVIIILFFFYLGDAKQEGPDVFYIPNFLDEEDHKQILELDKNKKDFIFEEFRYSKPLENGISYDILYSDKYLDKVKRVIPNEIFPSEFPIEHRYYPSESSGMQWHKDLLMYKEPQYEGIFTIRNTSESVTEWIDKDNKIHSLWTEPNSLLIVKAQGSPHHVTPIVKGSREILKIIYTQTNETNKNYDDEMKRFKDK